MTSCAICGSDLHLMNGYIPFMEKGDVLGHEFMGEVVEVGKDNKKLKVGDRVVVPFTICCGECEQCRKGNWAACETTNLDAEKAETMFGYAPAGCFGYSHLTGGYAGGQAEYVRVPYADVSPVKIPDGVSDEAALFLGDIVRFYDRQGESRRLSRDRPAARVADRADGLPAGRNRFGARRLWRVPR